MEEGAWTPGRAGVSLNVRERRCGGRVLRMGALTDLPGAPGCLEVARLAFSDLPWAVG